MNHEVFQYQDRWYYFDSSTGSGCTSGCEFPNSPGCRHAKASVGLPLCKGRTIRRLKPCTFGPNDTVTVVNTDRVYEVAPEFVSGRQCSSCEFRTTCSFLNPYCYASFTLQRKYAFQSQPQIVKATMPKVIRLSMRNYVDENNNIYDLRSMPRQFDVGDKVTIDSGVGTCENYVCRKVSKFNDPERSCSLLNCIMYSLCKGDSHLCRYGTALVPESVDFSAKYMKKSGGIECSKCAANMPGYGCCAHVIEAMNGIENHITCNSTFHYVKEVPQPSLCDNDGLQPYSKPTNKSVKCRIEDGVNSYSCIVDVDRIEKHHLIQHPTSTSCSVCILNNLTTKLCHNVVGACMTHDKAWIINPQCMDSLIGQQILYIGNINYIKGIDPIINSKPPLTPKECFSEEKHITIKRSSFKPKITKLKEVKWKTQTKKNL